MWDTRVIHPKTKESRIMLSIVLNRKQFLISVRLYSTKFDYDKALSGRSLTESQKSLRKNINEYVLKAESLLERLTEPSKESFLKFLSLILIYLMVQRLMFILYLMLNTKD